MKTQYISNKLRLLVLALLSLGAVQAQALTAISGLPVGVTFGQTARVTGVNTGTRALTINSLTFLDSEGAVLLQSERQVIEPGKMISFDLNADDLIREGDRIQVRVVISGNTLRGLLGSTEVFDNLTRQTSVIVGFNPQPDPPVAQVPGS